MHGIVDVRVCVDDKGLHCHGLGISRGLPEVAPRGVNLVKDRMYLLPHKRDGSPERRIRGLDWSIWISFEIQQSLSQRLCQSSDSSIVVQLLQVRIDLRLVMLHNISVRNWRAMEELVVLLEDLAKACHVELYKVDQLDNCLANLLIFVVNFRHSCLSDVTQFG